MTEPTPVSGGQPEITFGDLWRLSWRKLREMRTAFQIIAALAIGALICTVVPQNAPVEEYYTRYGRFLANIIVRLGLDHVHTSTWFLILLGLLMLSLVACSRRLWQDAVSRWRVPSVETATRLVSGSRGESGTAVLPLDQAAARCAAAARRRGFRAQRLPNEGDGQLLYLTRNRPSAWGQALAHYAIFAIALGSVLGSIPGLSLNDHVTIQEGQTVAAEHSGLPFAVKVDSFTIDHLETGEVSNYYSNVQLLQGDKVVSSGTISVNKPLKYRGYMLSQSDWGLGEARLEVTREGKTTAVAFPLARGGCPETGHGMMAMWGVPQEDAVAFLPDGKSALVATAFYADSVRKAGKVMDTGSQYPGTPAVNLTLVTGLPGHKPSGPATGEPGHGMADLGWLTPGQVRAIDGGSVRFLGITKTTGLGVRKDVGLPLVWIGFIASMVGLAMIFYFPARRAVLALQPQGGRTAVTLTILGRTSGAEAESLWPELTAALQANPATAAPYPKEVASSE